MVSGPGNGTLTLNPDGSFTYTPAPNFHGTDTFIYRLCDSDGDCDQATVTITVRGVDDPVDAVDDSYTTDEDAPVSGNVLGNDSYPDGLGSVNVVSGPGNGTLTLNPDGSFIYTPAPNFHGTDTFIYRLCDSDGDCDQATVTITVRGVDDPVDAVDDSYTTDEDAPVSGNVLGNDSYPDGLGSVNVVSGPGNGTLTLNPDGSFIYTPAPNFHGTDTFIYRLCDSDGDCDQATVTITVRGVDDPVDAVDDSYTTDEDAPVSGNVLGNDSYPDGLGSVNVVSGPGNGTLTLNPDGSFIYTPAPNFHGTDTFIYRLCDSDGDCDQATVTITVRGVDDPVDAVDDSYTTDEDAPVSGNVLGNDSYPDGLGSVNVVSGPGNGTLTLNPDGSFIYTPAPNFHGTDTFIYRLCDSDGDCDQATVTITVRGVDDPVDAVDDSYTTDEDAPVSGNVLGNDSYPDGLGSVNVVSGPGNGTLTLNPDGSFIYTPAPNFHGTDTFIYRLCDSDGDCDQATVTITVRGVDDPVDAVDDSYTTDEDAPVSGNVLGNDSYPDGLGSVNVVSGPGNGTLTLNPDGSFIYTPAPNFHGTDTFIYRLCDSDGDCDQATVTITVRGVDDPVDAVDDSYTTDEDAPVSGNVLGNDSYPDGLGSVNVVSGPGNGTLTLNPDGSFIYTPAPNFHGTDTFIYRLCDSDGDCDQATVTITVRGVDDPVDAVDDSYTTDEDAPVSGNVLGNDSYPDGLGSVNVVSGPGNGTLTLNPDGSFIYTPAPNFHGTDTFIYRLCDSDGDCDQATVTITVRGVDDPVDAVDDSYTTDEDAPVSGNVLGNDSYPDGLGSVNVVSGPGNGTLTLNPDGSFIYTPAPNFHGTDTFIYRLCDSDGDCDQATVTITVRGVDDPVDAVDDSYTTDEDAPVSGNVLGNDSYPDGLGSVNVVSGPGNGTLTLNPDGSFIYTPAPNFHGTDTFIYRLCDSDGDCDQATVTITVRGVDDPVDAVDDSYTTDEDAPVSGNVLGNDSYPDGLGSVNVVSGPGNGTLTLNPDGSFIYTPAPNFHGTDTFIYRLCDSDGDCDQATVTITVRGVDDPVDAVDDSYTTDEDAPVSGNVLGNDSYPDGLGSVNVVSGPGNGTLTLNPDGSFTYIPEPDYYGTDTFVYRLCDINGDCAEAVVTITVAFVNDPMEAEDLSLATCVNEAVRFEVVVKDADILWDGFTGYPVTFSLVSGPEHGTVGGDLGAVRYEKGRAALELLYTPDPNYIGADGIRIRVSDPYGETVVFTVRITVESCGLGPAGAAGFAFGPVVIHEIAWAGTAANPEDQWIELRNITDQPVDLNGWRLRWRKKEPKTPEDLIWREVELKGLIEPQGFFLLERGHDEVVKDIKADQIWPRSMRIADQEIPLLFSLDGDVVELLNPEGLAVDTANADPRITSGWAAGNFANHATMERKNPFLPDTLDNWWTNLGAVVFGKDTKDVPLRGTARTINEPEVLAMGGETLVVEQGQKVELARTVEGGEATARLVLLRGDVAGGAGAVLSEPAGTTVLYDTLTKRATVTVDTGNLEPGTYRVVVSFENRVVVFTLIVR